MRNLFRSTTGLILAITGCLLSVSASAAFAQRYPEPSVYPISWELRFKHASPRRIVVDVPGTAAPKAYWYLTYTVTNKSGSQQNYLPGAEVQTEDGTVYRANFGLYKEVFEAIKKLEGNDQLEPDTKITGAIQQGEDSAKDGVIIWPEPKTSMRKFTIYVSGLSGEHASVKDDSGQQVKNAEGQPIILRKTLVLVYQVRGGTESVVDPSQIKAEPDHWVMR